MAITRSFQFGLLLSVILVAGSGLPIGEGALTYGDGTVSLGQYLTKGMDTVVPAGVRPESEGDLSSDPSPRNNAARVRAKRHQPRPAVSFSPQSSVSATETAGRISYVAKRPTVPDHQSLYCIFLN